MSSIVQKFGGTSVGQPQRLAIVAGIIARFAREGSVCAVVSAMSGRTKQEGTTSRLLAMLELALSGQQAAIGARIEELNQFHTGIIREAVSDQDEQGQASAYVQETLVDLANFLAALSEVRIGSERIRDRVIQVGEQLSAKILSHVLRSMQLNSAYVDLSELMDYEEGTKPDPKFFRKVQLHLSQVVKQFFQEKKIPIVTGYLGHIPGGIIETVGRGYSDYTAALCAVGLGAAQLQIWKEVDGIFSADPRKVEDARIIENISYKEAAELTYFGTEAVHPRTMEPCVLKNIPIRVRNILNIDNSGTLVSTYKGLEGNPIKAITAKESISIIDIESNKMLDAPGFIQHIGDVFAKHDASIDLMATSEVSVSLTVAGIDEEKTKSILRDLDEYGIASCEGGYASISIIGHGMKSTPGIAGRVFTIMGAERINIILISRGASERSISFVINERDAVRAVRLLHAKLIEQAD